MLDALHALKDKGLSAALKLALREMLKRYGRVLELRIDTSAKSLVLTMLLDGEGESVDLSVRDYHLDTDDDTLLLRLGTLGASRPWLQALVNDAVDQLPDRTLRVKHPALVKVLPKIF